MSGPEVPSGPEFSRLSELAAEMGLRAATLIQDTRAGEVTGIRLYHRRWVVHRPTFAAWWSEKCRLEAQANAPIRTIPHPILGYATKPGRGALARAASNL